MRGWALFIFIWSATIRLSYNNAAQRKCHPFALSAYYHIITVVVMLLSENGSGQATGRNDSRMKIDTTLDLK